MLAPRLPGHEVRQFEVSPSDSALEELVRDTKDSVRRTVSGAYADSALYSVTQDRHYTSNTAMAYAQDKMAEPPADAVSPRMRST